MISKELFLEVIDLIKKQEENDRKITEVLPLFCDGNGLLFTGQKYYYKALIKLLKDGMNDRGNYIEWWLYEDVEKVIYCKDDDIDVSTAEKFSDFLESIK